MTESFGRVPAAAGISLQDPGPLANAGPVDVPATPSSPNAWARFEFQTGRGNEGTKVLMVEWDPTGDGGEGEDKHAGPQQQQSIKDHDGDWEVSWEGKTAAFSVSEKEGGDANHRIFFLLPPHHSVPPAIKISQPSTGRILNTKPMPAIYMPALGVDTTKEAGRRGVLHTIWAKRRVSQLQEEINQEMRKNSEGIAWHMAIEERDLLVHEFGLDDQGVARRAPPSTIPPTPQSPRSPIGGKLGEKLRGLKLATSPADLANPGGPRHHLYSLSPDTSDIAVPSRSALASSPPAATAGEHGPGAASLNAIVAGGNPRVQRPPPQDQGTGDELFALPMSPRSPEMKKSPFSIL